MSYLWWNWGLDLAQLALATCGSPSRGSPALSRPPNSPHWPVWRLGCLLWGFGYSLHHLDCFDSAAPRSTALMPHSSSCATQLCSFLVRFRARPTYSSCPRSAKWTLPSWSFHCRLCHIWRKVLAKFASGVRLQRPAAVKICPILLDQWSRTRPRQSARIASSARSFLRLTRHSAPPHH